MYLCHLPQHSHYTKHKSAKPYVPMPPPTADTLHKTQIGKHLCTLATAHCSHIKKNTNQQTLMYPCHCPQNSQYKKDKSANTYIPLTLPTPFALHKTQISKKLCTFANAHNSHIIQNTNQQTFMYPCHRRHK